jgi:carbonic anhydrase
MATSPSLGPEQALQKLLEGNGRFYRNVGDNLLRSDASLRQRLAQGQAPFAAILACSDSRISPNLAFNAGLGDLFVCRNAGNVCDETALGSLEYAALNLGVSVIAVMGHDHCGAVTAGVAGSKAQKPTFSPSLASLLGRLEPAVNATRPENGNDEEWIKAASRLHVALSCTTLLHHSAVIKEGVERGRLLVAGLWYEIASGQVTVIRPPPSSAQTAPSVL